MLFDFANSSYTTVVITVAFAVYFVEAVAPAGTDGQLYWGAAIAVSQFLVLCTAPIIGAIADYSAAKKKLLLVTFIGCVAATAALGVVRPGDLWLGFALLVASNVFFSSGENLIAAFLPEIAPPDKMGRISGYGWALGYIGGLGSLFACYPFFADGFGAENSVNIRWAFVLVACFFFAGGLPTALFLRERAVATRRATGRSYAAIGFSRVFGTLRDLRGHRQLFRFLGVFLVYNCGVQIVITFGAIFAESEIGMSGGELMIFFMILQVSAAVGAFGFGVFQDRAGAKAALALSLLVWIGVTLGAYVAETATHFYVVGNLAGVAMGSAQSGARALVGTFSPPGRSGEFFGFWGLVWKLSAALGPLMFGFASSQLGMRSAVLLTTLFFVVGVVGLTFVDEREGRREAESTETPKR